MSLPVLKLPVNLVDLGDQFLWVDCDQNYVSSTYRPALRGSALCSLARAHGCGDCFSGARPDCNNSTCGLTLDNTQSEPTLFWRHASFVNAVTKVFINEAAAVSIARVASVAPRIFGENSMVLGSDDVLCFGFVNIGPSPTTSTVIYFFNLF
ncbi:hypothetical protein Peur_044065 [Populus x canadensis]